MDGRRWRSVIRRSRRPLVRDSAIGASERGRRVPEMECANGRVWNGDRARSPPGGLQLSGVDRCAVRRHGSVRPAGDAAPGDPTQSQFTWLPLRAHHGRRGGRDAGPVPAIFPGPLVPPLFGAPISEAGFDQVVERARALRVARRRSVTSAPPDPVVGGLSGLIELRRGRHDARDHRRPEPDDRVHHDAVRSGAGISRRRSARSGASSGTCARWSATSSGRTLRITPRATRC